MVGLELRAAGAGLGLRVHWSSGFSSRAGLQTRTCQGSRAWNEETGLGPRGSGRETEGHSLGERAPQDFGTDMRPVLDYSVGSGKVRDLTN